MKFRLTTLILLLVTTWVAQAHEFWLHPDRFRFNVGESASVSFRIGENFTGQPWKYKRDKLESVVLYGKEKSSNLIAGITDGEKENLRVALTSEGTHIVALETTNAFIAIDGEKFNAYLKEDGLDEAYDFRKKNNQLADSATELYSRHSKLILQVGKNSEQSQATQVLGSPIEVVPLENPYSMKVGDRMRFKILFDGRPLFGARVKVLNRHDNRTLVQNIYTEKDGTIETTLSNPGMWMVHVVKMIPSKDRKAQWQSYWGNLVFGL